MTILKILRFPDPRLKREAHPVEKIDENLQRLLKDMLETLHLHKGIGLAAPQVNIPLRVVVIDLPQAESTMPLPLINPELIWTSEEQSWFREGCLSVPQKFAPVKRPQRIGYRFRDETGHLVEAEATGRLSHVIQHELDHLNGMLFLDHLSSLRRRLLMNH